MKPSTKIRGLMIGSNLEEQLQILAGLGKKAFEIHNMLPFKGADARLLIYKAMCGCPRVRGIRRVRRTTKNGFCDGFVTDCRILRTQNRLQPF